ncbi:MAG: hypothetical protein O3C34_04995 [Proteobacteria bacterium]|nr:hypothetical protein [Pseudomonadota bacterium]
MSWSDALAKTALTAALYLIVVGCQPVPQPFAHPESAINPIVVPSSDFAGITILPIAGLPDPTARGLSMAMAEALLSHEIIASPDRGNRRSRFLKGEVIRKAAGGTRTEIAVRWDLIDRSGKNLRSKDTTLTFPGAFPRGDWEKSGQSVLRPLVKAAAADIAKLVKGENDQSTNKSHITLHVWPLDGAPDRAAEPLRRAMEAALKKRDFGIANGLEGAGLIIAGSIELGPESAEPRPIRITWSVMDTAGQELGKLTQQNAIPRQAMETRWKTLAVLIADNAAGGVSDLVVQLPRDALRNDENPAK